MSGGIAYVYDKQNKLEKRLNREMVEILALVLHHDEQLVLTAVTGLPPRGDPGSMLVDGVC